jgi:predicted AAA+ superfamily ATPase
VIHLLGFSRREILGWGGKVKTFLPKNKGFAGRKEPTDHLSLKEIYKLIWKGSLPEIALREEMDRDAFFASYLQTYLQRDVHDLARVGDEMSFLRFLRAAAARTGQLLNMADLARDADIAPNTAKNWLSILQASGILYLLEPFHSNVTKRLVKGPKLYFLDTGLCAYLTEWSSPETLEAGAMSGAVFETWVVSELLKSYLHNGRCAPFYYYRDKDKKEIDLLIVQDGTIHPFEIKKTASPSRRDIRQFTVLEKLGMPVGPGGIICLAEQPLPLTETNHVVPVGLI